MSYVQSSSFYLRRCEKIFGDAFTDFCYVEKFWRRRKKSGKVAKAGIGIIANFT